MMKELRQEEIDLDSRNLVLTYNHICRYGSLLPLPQSEKKV